MLIRDDIDERRFKQIQQVLKISEAARIALIPTGPRITCCGTQPSRPSRVGHKNCGKQVSIEYAFRCLYCGFWFCRACAEVHFGMTREEHMIEYTSFDGTE